MRRRSISLDCCCAAAARVKPKATLVRAGRQAGFAAATNYPVRGFVYLEHSSSRVLSLRVGRACLTVKRCRKPPFAQQLAIDREFSLFRLCFYLAQSILPALAEPKLSHQCHKRCADRCASSCIALTRCMDSTVPSFPYPGPRRARWLTPVLAEPSPAELGPPAGVGSDRTQMLRLDPEPWKNRAAPEFKG